MKTVTVLMSAYNGGKYLHEQIDSILKQTDIDVRLVVRDDGSKDGTIELLEEYKRKGLLDWYSGDNLGPARSFLKLLKDAPRSYYYAFSDQDDYWMPDKLSVAVNSLKDYEDNPALYFCQTQLADSNLNKIPSVIIKPLLTFGEALVYQFVGGCTMVMNSKLREIVNGYSPSYLPMHDVWVYLIAHCVDAHIVFDREPHILYRQHGDNVIGQSGSIKTEWKRRWQRVVVKNSHSRYTMALELKKGFYDIMPEKNRKILDKFIDGHLNSSKRLSLLFDNRYKTSNKKVNLNFKLALLTNVY